MNLFVRLLLASSVVGVGCAAAQRYQSLSVLQATSLTARTVAGDTAPIHDPSLYLQNGTYFLFSTDPADPMKDQFLPIRCSTDKVTWRSCGQVFTKIPAWVSAAIPGISTLWAPDISYFGGLYHLYYAGSLLGSQSSVIGLATNTTLDPESPAYGWVDRGQVIASHVGGDFNAIDPNILVDGNGKVWLTYGSYWSGIKQREIEPATGMFLASNPVRYDLAQRPGVQDDAIEGASLVRHGAYYYLFLSVDHCCAETTAEDDYKQIVGRAAGPNGPFVDAAGAALMQGGGSIVLSGNGGWMAPGGGTALVDAETGESVLVFHALDLAHKATPALWVKTLTWENDWPVLH